MVLAFVVGYPLCLFGWVAFRMGVVAALRRIGS